MGRGVLFFNMSSRLMPQRHASGKQPSVVASLLRMQVEATGSHQQSLLPVDVQDLQRIWVHLPALMVSKLRCLWPCLQKSHIPPTHPSYTKPPSAPTSHAEMPGKHLT